MLTNLTIDDIEIGDTVRAKSIMGGPVVGVVTGTDPEDRGGVVDLTLDGGAEVWRRLDQIEMLVGADGVTKYATGPGWR